MNKKKARKKGLSWRSNRYEYPKIRLRTMKKANRYNELYYIDEAYTLENVDQWDGLYDNYNCSDTLYKADTLDKTDPFYTFYLNKLFEEILYPIFNPIRININSPIKAQTFINPKDITNIEIRLARHYKMLMGFHKPKNLSTLKSTISDSLKNFTKNNDYLNYSSNKKFDKFYDAYSAIFLFAPFWVRNPYSWNPDSKVTFLEHVFALYETPKVMKYWGAFSDLMNFLDLDKHYVNLKSLYWFILFSQGGSLKKAANLFDWNIPAKLQYYLFKVPQDFVIANKGFASLLEKTIKYADVLRLGASETVAKRLVGSQAFECNFDPTSNYYKKSYIKFWRDTVLWFIRYGSKVTEEQSKVILIWAKHKYTEAECCGTSFSWKKLRPNSVLQRSYEYENSFITRKQKVSKRTWNVHNWNWLLNEEPNKTWSFEELTSEENLYQEGKTLHHCVGNDDYTNKCVEGSSAIVSLRYNNMPCITIEINPLKRSIVQVKGEYNREPNIKEQRVISQWKKTFSLN